MKTFAALAVLWIIHGASLAQERWVVMRQDVNMLVTAHGEIPQRWSFPAGAVLPLKRIGVERGVYTGVVQIGRGEGWVLPREMSEATPEQVAVGRAMLAQIAASYETRAERDKDRADRRAQAAADADEQQRLLNEWRWRMDNLQRAVEQTRR